MRMVPKTAVAAYVHRAGLLPALWTAAASQALWAPAAQGFLDHIFDPESANVDPDNDQWVSGCAALVYGDVVAQDHVTAIEALYVDPVPWTYKEAVADGSGRWLLVFERGNEQRSVQVKTETPSEHAATILASGSL